MNKKGVFIIIYTIIVGLEIVSAQIPSLSAANYIAKPAIVSSLLIYFLSYSSPKPFKIWVILALVFSFIGDVLLLFADGNELFFLFGLIAFLLAHLVYIKIFSFNQNKGLNLWPVLIGFILYGTLLFLMLKNHLGQLLVAVAVYMLVILSMGISAYRRKGAVTLESFRLVFTGALLFMASDSILAINKFYSTIPYNRFLIMVTYAFAQYFIVIGLLKTNR